MSLPLRFADQVRPLLATVLTAAVVTGIISQRHAGFMLGLLVVALIPWLLYSVYVMLARPAARGLQVRKVAIWCIAIAVIVSVHYLMYSSSQRHAQSVVDAVEAYSSRHGSYPESLEAIGMTNEQLQSKVPYAWYAFHEGKPLFYYQSTYVPFDQEKYDFETHEWHHVYD